MNQDKVVFDLIEKEKLRQQNGVELIASENFVSKQVLKAQGSILTNKYAEGLPRKRYYGGCEFVDEIEQIAIDRVKQLFGASWANVQPHSGAQANAAVMLGCLKPGDKILGFDLSHGGHLTHGSAVNFSGKLYQPSFYGVDKNSGVINFDEVIEQARREKPKMIICGASAYSREWDYKKLREAADAVGAVLLADISHPAGLIARGLLNDPLPYCHVVTTTTHKTLRGPRGGVIMVGENIENFWGVKTSKGKLKKISSVLDSAVFPGTQGGPLEHVIAAKAIAFEEALTDEYMDYVVQVVKNAKYMANEFSKRGYQIVSNGTDNHMILIDLSPQNLTGNIAEDTLKKISITINKNMVPFDTQPPTITSGMRLGTSAITTRGLKETEVVKIVEWIDEAIKNPLDEKRLDSINDRVVEQMNKFPIYV